jgi:hypothetical protein
MADHYDERDDRDRLGRDDWGSWPDDRARRFGPDDRGRDDRDRYEVRSDRAGRAAFDRAGDEARSWFGDESASRRRDLDERDADRAGRERAGYEELRGRADYGLRRNRQAARLE